MVKGALVDNDDWIENISRLCGSKYLGENGILITSLHSDGSIDDNTPLVADFGDVLPFLSYFGAQDFSDQQIERATPLLKESLFHFDGRLRLFDNHDWLLGLLELNELRNDPALIQLAVKGAKSIIRTMFVRGLLIDETLIWNRPKTWAMQASPFNGGYIELWVDLYRLTGDREFLEASELLANAWSNTSRFRKTSVFHRELCAYSTRLGLVIRPFSNLSARLFKDNTNFIWGVLSLFELTQSSRWSSLIDKWIIGFRDNFLNDGDVWLWIDKGGQGKDVSLKAAFSSIDLLCDLHLAGFHDGPLAMAEVIARRWESYRWREGLYPELAGGERDHLDANVDMAIALLKLSALSGNRSLAAMAKSTANAIVERHASPFGLVQAVDAKGNVVDGRIIVKYQSLALKLAIAPADPRDLTSNPSLLKLLRDR